MEETGMRVLVSFFVYSNLQTRCESLNMLIEGRIGTRAGSEHYGQYDKKIV